MSEYKPGDVVNGHVLTADGRWVLVAAPPAADPTTRQVVTSATGTAVGCLSVPILIILGLVVGGFLLTMVLAAGSAGGG